MRKEPCVYILANGRRGTLYVGVTSHLVKRVWEHKNDIFEGFTSKYGVKALVWFETQDDMRHAIAREKIVKKWCRREKLAAIEDMNPEWRDLYFDLL